MNRDNNFLILMLLLIVLEAFLFFSGHAKLNKEYKIEQEKIAKIQALFDDIPFFAKAVSIYDATENKEIYGKNQKKILPIASLVKIMTIVVALEEYNLEDQIKILKKSLNQNGNNGLLLDEKWKIKDLIKFTLITSANDGAYALSNNGEEFLERMNNKTAEIGLENTIFFNSTGLDIDEGFAGAYSTAEEVNIMALYVLRTYPEIFRATVLPEIEFKSESGFIHKVKNTNAIIDKIPNVLFSKTGLTTLAGGNLVIIFQNKEGHEIAITILGSTEQGRFSDMEKLVEIVNDLQ